MKNKAYSTNFLKLIIFLSGVFVVSLYILIMSIFIKEISKNYEFTALYPTSLCFTVSLIPFYFALYRTLNILSYIDKNNAFSNLSVNALKSIKNCAISISIIHTANLPFLCLWAHKAGAPGIIIIGLVLVFIPIIIATFSEILKRLLKQAIDIKNDNDLTI